MGYARCMTPETPKSVPLHEELAERLRQLLDAHYDSAADAAASMGISQTRVSRLVNANPKVWGAVQKLDTDLRQGGLDPHELLVADQPVMTPEGRRAAEIISEMNPQLRAAALHVLTVLVELDSAMPSGRDLADLQVLRSAQPLARRIMMDGLRQQQGD